MELTRALDVPNTGRRPRIDHVRGLLVGSRCTKCLAMSWPARAVCHRCGSPTLEPALFGPRGKLVTYTTVWVSRPGLPTPYVLGQVDLGDSVRVVGHIRGVAADAKVPLSVRLVVESDENAFPPFWFKPEDLPA